MTSAIIITICTLLLVAYIFDLTASLTRIPAVLLMLVVGFLVRKTAEVFNIQIPNLNGLLPILGSLGLILIVLEGALELEFNQSKLKLIRKSFLGSLIPIAAFSFLFAYIIMLESGVGYRQALINAIPFSVISSSIAIPSVRTQSKEVREFVIYESSFADILGILFFNFFAINSSINLNSFGNFGLELLMMALISFVATVGLALLLSKIDHHVKFAPIVILVILVYEISKEYNLPALIFILLFGLFLGNLDELKRFRIIQKLNPMNLNEQIFKFREIVTEAAFIVRALFFLLFGYLMKASEILNTETFLWSGGIVAGIYLLRVLILRMFKMKISPLLFVAPRGLINILLFLSITAEQSISFINRAVVIQVIFLTSLVLMIGMVFSKSTNSEEQQELKEEPYLI
jgi:hypothetical protein